LTCRIRFAKNAAQVQTEYAGMTPKTKLASGWGIAGIIVAIATFLITNVLASKPELSTLAAKVQSIEMEQKETRTDLREIKGDIKLLIREVKAR
jgi:biopolymer transport protein ExbB/TolQ